MPNHENIKPTAQSRDFVLIVPSLLVVLGLGGVFMIRHFLDAPPESNQYPSVRLMLKAIAIIILLCSLPTAVYTVVVGIRFAKKRSPLCLLMAALLAPLAMATFYVFACLLFGLTGGVSLG